MRIDLHAKVLTRDGESIGRVNHAVIDPDTNEITEFVVGMGGLLGRDILVPRAEIDQASPEGDELHLRVNREQLDRLPTYAPADYGLPPSGWMPPPTTTFPYAGFLWPATRVPIDVSSAPREPWQARRDVLIDKGSAVLDRNDEHVGVVEDIITGPDGAQLEAFDVRLGGAVRTLLPGGDVIRLSINVVESVEPAQVRLRIDKASLEHQHG